MRGIRPCMRRLGWQLICLVSAARCIAGVSQLPFADIASSPRASRLSRRCPQLHMPKQQQDAVTAADQEAAASALVGRLLPADAAATFAFQINQAQRSRRAEGAHGGFTVVGSGDSIAVAGNSGVDLAAGVYWFLKHRPVSACQGDSPSSSATPLQSCCRSRAQRQAVGAQQALIRLPLGVALAA